VWALLLLPTAIRSRIVSSPVDAVARFERAMGILESARRPAKASAASGRWIMVPRHVNAVSRRRNRIIRRRRQNFTRMLAFCGASLMLALLPRLHWMVWVHLSADAALGLYVWRLLVYKQRERQRAAVVTELPLEAAADEGDLIIDLDQPASSSDALDLDAPTRRVIAK
jgi:hypothetical protein